ncbi:MAG: hypothetical protein ACE5J6_04250, partial [Candidatus Bathyarchaeia archaeon]
TISMVQADILTPWWVDPEYRGYDSLSLNEYIVAYVTGTTAKLCVPVENDYGGDINVTAVQVWLDWGKTYNSTECSEANPFEMEEDDVHTFTISFTVPSTTVASNYVLHDWEVIIKYERAGVPSTDRWRNEWAPGPTYYFAVFSATQAEAFQLYNELDAAFDYSPYFSTVKAKVLWGEAVMQNSIGMRYYRSGRFTDANTTFYNTRNLVDQAFEAEDERGSKLEDAQINYYNAAMTEAYAWLLFGLGMILIGIGAIIYAVKKPKITKATKAA